MGNRFLIFATDGTGGPPEATSEGETDLSALAKGDITLTPLGYNMTMKSVLAEMESWQFRLPDLASEDAAERDPEGAEI